MLTLQISFGAEVMRSGTIPNSANFFATNVLNSLGFLSQYCTQKKKIRIFSLMLKKLISLHLKSNQKLSLIIPTLVVILVVDLVVE